MATRDRRRPGAGSSSLSSGTPAISCATCSACSCGSLPPRADRLALVRVAIARCPGLHLDVLGAGAIVVAVHRAPFGSADGWSHAGACAASSRHPGMARAPEPASRRLPAPGCRGRARPRRRRARAPRRRAGVELVLRGLHLGTGLGAERIGGPRLLRRQDHVGFDLRVRAMPRPRQPPPRSARGRVSRVAAAARTTPDPRGTHGTASAAARCATRPHSGGRSSR